MRYKTTSVRIFDQMQHTREKMVFALGAADIDNGGVFESRFEEIEDALASLIVQRIENFIDDHPARLMQRDTRKDQELLLVVREFLIPACDLIKRRDKAIQPRAPKRLHELFIFECRLLRGV